MNNQNLPNNYFEDFEEKVALRVETERVSPHLAQIFDTKPQTNDLPSNYFEGLEAVVCEKISQKINVAQELLRLSPNIAPILLDFDKKTNDLPFDYFEKLENRVFETINEDSNQRTKPELRISKTQNSKKMWWTLGSVGAAAAIFIGVFFVSPKKSDLAKAETNTTPISEKTQALFASVNTAEAVSFLKENAVHLDESLLEKHSENIDKQHFTSIEKTDIADFIEENNITFED
jgi:hypothetical protein